MKYLDENETYIDPVDGLRHCKVCGEVRQTVCMGQVVGCACSCKQKEIAERDAKEKQLKDKLYIRELKRVSLIGTKFKDVSFENTETDHSAKFKEVYNRCIKYCQIADTALKQGIGIYLYGDKGTGKSRLTACIANSLLEQGHSTLYTNFDEISKYIRNSYSNHSMDSELEFLQKLDDVEFLILDDFGTEKVAKGNQDLWLQEKVFGVINRRYNYKKPVIITSNYSLRQLIDDRGVADKTVDRIAEMCEVIKLEGSTYRMMLAKARPKLF